MRWLEYFKQKWGIQSWFQLGIIFLVFALTGSSAMWTGKKLMLYLGFTPERLLYAWWPVRIVFITLVYQVLLLFWGTLLGQFKFFWNFEKKMFSRFKRKP